MSSVISQHEIPCIKFDSVHTARILSGEKTTTIRLKTDLSSNDMVKLVDLDGNIIAIAVVQRVFYGFSISKKNECTSGFPHNRLMAIIKSEGGKWSDVLDIVKKYYALPFCGVVISFKLENSDGGLC